MSTRKQTVTCAYCHNQTPLHGQTLLPGVGCLVQYDGAVEEDGKYYCPQCYQEKLYNEVFGDEEEEEEKEEAARAKKEIETLSRRTQKFLSWARIESLDRFEDKSIFEIWDDLKNFNDWDYHDSGKREIELPQLEKVTREIFDHMRQSKLKR